MQTLPDIPDDSKSSEPSESYEPLGAPEPQLIWKKDDIEQRLGFRGGRYTAVNRFVSLGGGILLSILFYLILVYVLKPSSIGKHTDMFLIRSQQVVVPIVVLFFWCFAILFLKARKLKYQRKALDLAAMPQDPRFVLNPVTARSVLEKMRELVDDPRHFVLLNRIERALSNLHNIGRISDVSDILRVQAEYDEELQDSSYRLLNGFIWAIPVLGFIGTVLGLSSAIGGFGATLATTGGDTSALTASLGGVTGGLSTAFETTLIALVSSLIVQLRMTFLQQDEANFLDECNDYCHAHVVSRLRLEE